MSSPKQTTYYADYLTFNLEKRARQINRVLFYSGAVLFFVAFFGLIFQAKKANEMIDSLQNYIIAVLPYNEPLRFLILPLFLWLLLPWIPQLFGLIRKYILYPYKSLTLQTTVPVLSKEVIIYPRSFRSGARPRSHFIKVSHPTSGKLIHFDVHEILYNDLNPGAPVHVRYHPVEENVLCMLADIEKIRS